MAAGFGRWTEVCAETLSMRDRSYRALKHWKQRKVGAAFGRWDDVTQVQDLAPT